MRCNDFQFIRSDYLKKIIEVPPLLDSQTERSLELDFTMIQIYEVLQYKSNLFTTNQLDLKSITCCAPGYSLHFGYSLKALFLVK